MLETTTFLVCDYCQAKYKDGEDKDRTGSAQRADALLSGWRKRGMFDVCPECAKLSRLESRTHQKRALARRGLVSRY